MAGDWFKMLGDVADAFGIGDDVAGRGTGAVSAYLGGRSTETDSDNVETPYVYERWLTRPRDPSINDR